MSSQSFLSGQAGLKGRIFFQFSFAFSGLPYLSFLLLCKKKLEAWGDGKRKRWEKTAIMAL